MSVRNQLDALHATSRRHLDELRERVASGRLSIEAGLIDAHRTGMDTEIRRGYLLDRARKAALYSPEPSAETLLTETLPPEPANELPANDLARDEPAPGPERCSCDEALSLRTRLTEAETQLAHLSALLEDAEDRAVQQQSYTLENAQHWEKAEAELAALTDKQYKAVALLIDANLRGDRLEARAKLWRTVARMKHRALHMTEPRRFDSQLERPVRGG